MNTFLESHRIMSAQGQTRTSADVFDTTASPPRPDVPDSP